MTKFSKNLTNKYNVIRLLKINTIAISTKIATEKSRPFYQELTRGRNFSANQKISIDRNEPIGNQEEAKKFAFCVFSGNSLQYFRGGLEKKCEKQIRRNLCKKNVFKQKIREISSTISEEEITNSQT